MPTLTHNPTIREPERFYGGSIYGVETKPLAFFSDDRGWLFELFRQDQLHEELLPVMAYVSLTLPGVVRGPHQHAEQTDHFAFIGPGSFTLYLWDVRAESPTWSQMMKLLIDESHRFFVTVPPGVVHAYKNTGQAPGLIFNCPNRLFAGEGKNQPIDEIRHEQREHSPYKLD